MGNSSTCLFTKRNNDNKETNELNATTVETRKVPNSLITLAENIPTTVL